MNAIYHIKVAQSNSAISVDPGTLLGIIEWLSGDECHAADEVGLIAGLGKRLRTLGLPIDRLTLHLMTLHPEFIGRALAWSPDEPIEVHERAHGAMSAFADSPLQQVMETRETLHVGPADSARWADIDVFSGRSLVHLMVAPLCNADGPVSAVSFGTRRHSGFSPAEKQVITRILPALRNACELRSLRQAELSLLDTYIGPLTAQRILAGRIRQGEIESLEAALLLCDIRGFTSLSNRLPSGQMLRLLNSYFDKVVPAITNRGGEVLKFMGDGVLAFFPGYDQEEACQAALAAATAILNEVDRFEFEGVTVKSGIGLHFGEVSYGNVGSGRRLDFTLIGSDINRVSRIQAVCSTSSMPLLMSGEFREKGQMEKVSSSGFHSLAGFEQEVELFTI